tara:strand:+ start:1709 stop:1921 length:213 start_codon:yes stop_codon:yes gene_type:complete
MRIERPAMPLPHLCAAFSFAAALWLAIYLVSPFAVVLLLAVAGAAISALVLFAYFDNRDLNRQDADRDEA